MKHPPGHISIFSSSFQFIAQNVEKAAEHACSVCEEQMTQLIGIPCQHVQTWPGENSTGRIMSERETEIEREREREGREREREREGETERQTWPGENSTGRIMSERER